MPTPKTTSKTQTTEARLSELEQRLDALEAGGKCAGREGFKTFCEACKCPTQEEARAWIKANPFLALAIAVLGTALIVSILG